MYPHFKSEVHCTLRRGINTAPGNGIQLPPLSYWCRVNFVSPQRLSWRLEQMSNPTSWLSESSGLVLLTLPRASTSGESAVPRLCAVWHKATEPPRFWCSRHLWSLEARIHFSFLCGNSFPTAQQVYKFYYGVQPTAITQTQLQFTVYLGWCIKIMSLITFHALQIHSST